MPYKIYATSHFGGRQKPAIRRTKKAAQKLAARGRKLGWKTVTIRKVSGRKKK